MKKLRLRKKKEITPIRIIPECLNCGMPLRADDVFCSYCGQKNVEKLSFGSFISQVINGLFSYDSRFWTTFTPLIFKPGLVSKNYIAGKRKRYVNPFQLYLQVSILFFLLLGLTNSFSDDTNDDLILENDDKIALDSLSANLPEEVLQNIDTVDQQIITNLSDGVNISEMLVDSTYQYKIKSDSISTISLSEKLEDFYAFHKEHPKLTNASTALDSLGYPVTFWNKFGFEQVLNAKTKVDEFREDKGKGFIKNVISKLSIALFIFLPIFTLSFKLIYYRKHMNFMEHLIFVFHVQTVFFLLFTMSILLELFVGIENTGVFLILFLIYLYLALKKFYNQHWFKTLIKFSLLNIIYMQIGGVAALILAVIAFMFN